MIYSKYKEQKHEWRIWRRRRRTGKTLARTEKGKECLENVFCKIKQRYVLT